MPESEVLPVAVLVALHQEFGALLPILKKTRRLHIAGRRALRGSIDSHDVVLLATGMGASNAREAALQLIRETAPRAIVATGFAGAIEPSLETGDVVVGDSVVDEHHVPQGRTFAGHPLLVDAAMRSEGLDGKVVTGTLATVDQVVGDVESKVRFRATHDAVAVDMESVGVARAANVYDIPLLCARVIVDDANTALPFDANRLVGPKGGVRWLSAITYFLTHPALIGKVPAFHARCQHAGRNLAAYVNDLVCRIPTQF